MQRIQTNKKIIIPPLLITILYIWYIHITSFNNICEFVGPIEIDHNNHPVITRDGTHIAYINMRDNSISVFSAPKYNKNNILASGRIEAMGYDILNNLYYVTSYNHKDQLDSNTRYERSYVNIYKNGVKIETILEPTDRTYYKKYFTNYYELPLIFESKDFGQISSILEKMERFYHKSYIIIGNIKIKVTSIEKPIIQLQSYSDNTKKYTAVINDNIYTCDLNKLNGGYGIVRVINSIKGRIKYL